jgi:hypothetical protein
MGALAHFGRQGREIVSEVPVSVFGVRKEQAHARVDDKKFKLGARRPCAQRNERSADGGTTKDEFKPFDSIAEHRADMMTARDPAFSEGAGRPARTADRTGFD